MKSFSGIRFRAEADVDFPDISSCLDAILESIATHDVEIEAVDGTHVIRSSHGFATMSLIERGFRLTVEAEDAGALNRLKYALAGPIGFIAAEHNIQIEWQGDQTEPALPDDLRILHVRTAYDIGPRMRRIVFVGDDLQRYDRDDQLHCRLIFQPRGATDLTWPRLDHRGHVVWPGGAKIDSRVYTIRAIDVLKGEISVDFALHNTAGPATTWAKQAEPGDIVGILGPAAHGPKPASFYVLAGDETGLPGIARILERMPADVKGFALIEINSDADQLPLRAPVGIAIQWLCRNGAPAGSTTLLEDALTRISWPEDLAETFFWGGCEHAAFSAIHRHLKREVGLPRDRFVLYSHWHRTMSEEDIIAKGAVAYLPG